MKYLINDKEYKIITEYILEDELYESTLSCDDGEPAGIKFFGYGDTEEEAIRELKERLFEVGIKEEIPNHIVSSEDRRKILVYMKGVKSELLGEWITEEERYKQWRTRVFSKYGYKISTTYEEYRQL